MTTNTVAIMAETTGGRQHWMDKFQWNFKGSTRDSRHDRKGFLNRGPTAQDSLIKSRNRSSAARHVLNCIVVPQLFTTPQLTLTGHFIVIGSANWPDQTLGWGLTPDNKGTMFLCLALTNRSPRKLEAQGDSKWSRLTHGVTDLDSSISK